MNVKINNLFTINSCGTNSYVIKDCACVKNGVDLRNGASHHSQHFSFILRLSDKGLWRKLECLEQTNMEIFSH